MTLPESSDPSAQTRSRQTVLTGREPATSPIPVDPALLRLRAALSGLFTIAGEEHRQDRRSGARVYVFRGTLNRSAIAATGRPAYALLQERFAPLGFTPLLQRQGDEDAVVAVPGTLPQPRLRTRWWLHLLLLLATIVTTTVMGAALTGLPPGEAVQALRTWNTTRLWSMLRDGLPFSLTLLTILGVHEMGHYVAARLHGVRVTLPFFIPLPVSGSLGTLGAVIFIRSPLLNRRALFDVGIAGPLAGLIVALPLYLIGLTVEPAVGLPRLWMEMGIRRVANPPLLEWLAPLVTSTADLDQYVFYRHPMALAAWFGVLLTALNLLPLGQFDGGHVAYALLGRRAWPLALFTFFTLLTLGLTGAWFGWVVWALMGLLTGLRHPPPHDDLTPLDWPRVALGLATAVLFALLFVPVPFYAP
jgi:membrane-associated protease RseP (regulator of RpoE activity)